MSLTLATFALVSASTARPQTEPTRLPADAFAPVVIPSAPASPGGPDVAAPRPASPIATASPGEILDFSTAQRSMGPRPDPDIAAHAGIETRPTPTPKSVAPIAKAAPARPSQRARPAGPARTGHVVSGPASWYCKTGVSACAAGYPGGMYAAAGPALRVGAWRGRTVQVCGSGGCISVKLIDWCACPGGRVIDLYSDAYQRLSPLSTGTQRVRVSW